MNTSFPTFPIGFRVAAHIVAARLRGDKTAADGVVVESCGTLIHSCCSRAVAYKRLAASKPMTEAEGALLLDHICDPLAHVDAAAIDWAALIQMIITLLMSLFS